MRSHKDDRMQRGKTLNEDRSACLVSNLFEFRSPICHHVDLASMGMHPKFCKLRIVPGKLKTLPTWNPCLVRGKVFLGVEAVLSTGAILEAVPNRVLSREAMSTGAMFWRQEQSFVDRSRVVAIKTILEVVRVEQGKMLSTEAMSTRAVFCRQEPCCGDSNPEFCRRQPCCGDKNNPGGCPCRRGQDVVD